MQDLTHDARTGAKAILVGSSMSAGNTVSGGDPAMVMTAPGSRSILPVPDAVDYLPLPEMPDSEIPVSHPGQQEKTPVQSANYGAGRWTDAHDIPSPSRWKEADGSG